jgi:wyosine [tRNA(Phe)-imidazoG37] synthetase (radical SAM superfamily)
MWLNAFMTDQDIKSPAPPNQPPDLVFGPVPSRRLGLSLGVDMVPYKTCTYDCIYCQLGRTTCHTAERRAWRPAQEIIAAVERKLAKGPQPEVITLAGSGEPTLNSGLGQVIRGIKKITDLPVAVLTNGSLFHLPEVRDDVSGADLILPSLDAPDENLFAQINQPAEGITFQNMVEGLHALRREFLGIIWLEVFLINQITTAGVPLAALAEIARSLEPDKIQLNTAVRPTERECALRVPPGRLQALVSLFGESAEMTADYRRGPGRALSAIRCDDVLELLRRRPCTMSDIAGGLSIHPNEAVKHIDALLRDQLIEPLRKDDSLYYRARI